MFLLMSGPPPDRPLDDLCRAAYFVLANHGCPQNRGEPSKSSAERCGEFAALYDALVAISSPWLEQTRQLQRPV
jgi:hypothetical protein